MTPGGPNFWPNIEFAGLSRFPRAFVPGQVVEAAAPLLSTCLRLAGSSRLGRVELFLRFQPQGFRALHGVFPLGILAVPDFQIGDLVIGI